MQSSVLIDGMFVVPVGIARTVSAHVAIGFTGHRHRQSRSVGSVPPQTRYRASRLPGLYHSFAAFADLLELSGRQPADGKLSVLMSSRCSAVAPWLHSSCRSPASSKADIRDEFVTVQPHDVRAMIAWRSNLGIAQPDATHAELKFEA